MERWLGHFGPEATARLVAADNSRPQIYIRAIGISADQARARARSRNIVLEPALHGADALRIADGGVRAVLAALPAIVQDPAAALIARYAAPGGGVLADVCAAPGGKAIGLADALRGRGRVVASDIAFGRLQRALENARRIGELPLHFIVADARAPAVASANTVLIDAPCTGTGTFRRHPDGKWRVQPQDLLALVALQREILDASSEIMAVGGVLVYSTCSLEPEENQEQVKDFLDRHPNFLRRPPSGWSEPAMIDEVGNLVVLPQEHGFDGSFAARLERVA